jgi:N-acetylglutamate synthase-like GNAT family acetyltransferase
MKNKNIEIIIRDAEKDDCEAIARLLAELGYPNTPQFAAKKINRLSKKINNRILIATVDSMIVGALSLHIVPLLHQAGDLCRVTAIIVSKDYRGKSIGRRLMEIAEAYAQSNGCIKVEITSGDHRNEAHSFYRQIGYKEVSRRFIKLL